MRNRFISRIYLSHNQLHLCQLRAAHILGTESIWVIFHEIHEVNILIRDECVAHYSQVFDHRDFPNSPNWTLLARGGILLFSLARPFVYSLLRSSGMYFSSFFTFADAVIEDHLGECHS